MLASKCAFGGEKLAKSVDLKLPEAFQNNFKIREFYGVYIHLNLTDIL